MEPGSGPGRGRGSNRPITHADETGAASLLSAVVLAVVLLATGVTAVLLGRVMDAATNINEKAAAIAESGRGINIATDSVIQLRRTNDIAASILDSAQPLEGQLTGIVEAARGIDAAAASINGTAAAIDTSASAIDGSADTVGGTARGINARAAEILAIARRIDDDARRINENLDATIRLARAIRGDTSNIVDAARTTHRHAACIDRKVAGQSGGDGHCTERGG